MPEGERKGPAEAAEGGTDLRATRRDPAAVHPGATRTHHTVLTLAAALKEVVQRQDRYERGLNLNSFVAYVLFTVLLGGGFFLLYRSRADRLVRERGLALRQRAVADEEADRARKALAGPAEAPRRGRRR